MQAHPQTYICFKTRPVCMHTSRNQKTRNKPKDSNTRLFLCVTLSDSLNSVTVQSVDHPSLLSTRGTVVFAL